MFSMFRKRKDGYEGLPPAYRKCINEISGNICNKRIVLRPQHNRNDGQLRLKLSYDSNCVYEYELGNYSIEKGDEEKMRNLLFCRLCIHTFLRLFGKTGNEVIELLMQVAIAPFSLEASICNRAFRTLFDAACHFHLDQDGESQLKKLAVETLRTIRPAAADELIRALAFHYTQILRLTSKGKTKINNEFNISYSSNYLDGVCTVRCFCPLESMKRQIYQKAKSICVFRRKKEVSDLDSALSDHQLECKIELKPEVKFHNKSIEVGIHVKNLSCGAFQLGSHERVQPTQGNGRHTPVRIIVRVEPKQTSNLLRDSFGASKSNPDVNCSQSSAREGSIQVGPGFNGQVAGKRTVTNTVSSSWNDWYFEPSATAKTFKWTLYHRSYPKEPVYSYSPESTSDKIYKTFEGLLRAVGPTSPFTEGGAVEFAEDMYGEPIKWTFDKTVRGKSLDWFVQCEIWLAYYSKDCMEIRHQKFRDVFQFPMKRSQR